MPHNSTYTEENIRSLDWKEHIRMRPGMYIGKLGDGSAYDDGIYILLKEVLDNSIDEFVMGAGKTIEIIIVFIIVPIPGFCLRGIHNNNTKILTKKVDKPIVKFELIEIPWAKTVQGLTPCEDEINNVSPKPNNIKPKFKYKKVDILGFKLSSLYELHDKDGIFLIVKISLTICIRNFFIFIN